MLTGSNALNQSAPDDAELAREIIALANNGDPGYILIGVSKDGSEFFDVANPALTDQGLQEFCERYIDPVPQVRLERCKWEDAADEDLRGITMVVITVGPQWQRCFRFNRDIIDFRVECCHRKNEVWIRRDTENGSAVTVPATPEEIKNLLEAKVKPAPRVPRGTYKDYTHLPFDILLADILDELDEAVTKIGGKLVSDKDPFSRENGSLWHHLVLPVNGYPMVLRLLVIEKCVTKNDYEIFCRRFLTLQHGVLLIALGEIKPDVLPGVPVKVEESWGCFFTGPYLHPGLRMYNLEMPVPRDLEEKLGDPDSMGFALAKITGNRDLRKKLEALLATLSERQDYQQLVRANQIRINAILSWYLKESCPRKADKSFIPKQLLANEIWEPKRYGRVLLIRQPELTKTVQSYLDQVGLEVAGGSLETG